MAMVPFKVDIKACATCRWWCGSRELIFATNNPLFVKADTTPSQWMATPRLPKGPGGSCARYQRWEKL